MRKRAHTHWLDCMQIYLRGRVSLSILTHWTIDRLTAFVWACLFVCLFFSDRHLSWIFFCIFHRLCIDVTPDPENNQEQPTNLSKNQMATNRKFQKSKFVCAAKLSEWKCQKFVEIVARKFIYHSFRCFHNWFIMGCGSRYVCYEIVYVLKNMVYTSASSFPVLWWDVKESLLFLSV